MAAVRVEATAFVHQGAVRASNQDTVVVGEWLQSEPMGGPESLARRVDGPLIALVADGMGGHAAGEVASRAVGEHLRAHAADAVGALSVAGLVADAHAELHALMDDEPALNGMGTTVAGLAITSTAVIVFNVGDSRAYRIAGRHLVQLSTDDTPGPKLADGRTAATTSHFLTQCLGGAWHDAEIVPHLVVEPVEPGARYLLCTDGVTDLLDRPTMEALIGDQDRATVLALFEAAMAEGGRDNIALVVLRIEAG